MGRTSAGCHSLMRPGNLAQVSAVESLMEMVPDVWAKEWGLSSLGIEFGIVWGAKAMIDQMACLVDP